MSSGKGRLARPFSFTGGGVTAARSSARNGTFQELPGTNVDPKNPLPPEPASTPAGQGVGALLWLLLLVATSLVLMGIWGVGSTEVLLKTAATAGLLVLVGSLVLMSTRR